jgi:hypothetical protein
MTGRFGDEGGYLSGWPHSAGVMTGLLLMYATGLLAAA